MSALRPNEKPKISLLPSDLTHIAGILVAQDHEVSNEVQKGRWTEEEHKRFLQSIRLFGKDWKRV